jgi:hypothetical protein
MKSTKSNPAKTVGYLAKATPVLQMQTGVAFLRCPPFRKAGWSAVA